MRQTSIYSLITIFVLTLLFPKSGSLEQAAQAQAAQNNAVKTSATILVTVVQPSVTAKISVSEVAIATSASCFGGAGSQSNIVQNAGVVNLNQPANCFSLSDSSSANFSGVRLSVVSPAMPAVKVSVITPQVKISAFNFNPAPAGQSIPVLPLTFFATGILWALSERKNIFKKLSQKLSSLKTSLSLQQLQVMRC